MKRFLIMFMVLGLIAGSVATAEAEQGFERTERSVEASYYGAQLLYEYRSCAVSGGAGCVTVQTLAGEDSLTASVTDAHGQPVTVWVVDASERRVDLNGTSAVYGRFCGKTADPIRFDPGAQLEFWVGGHWHSNWWIVPQVNGCFPGAATTGTISVTLSGWTTSEEPAAPSPTPAESPAPEPSPSDQPAVERSVDLALKGHLRGVGSVVAADASCRSEVPVVIQRKTSDAWLDIASTTTDADGSFAVRLADRSGRYRAVASEFATPDTTCLEARSATVRHHH